MAKRKYGKKNEVKVNPLNYNICLLGEPKIGKTTLIKQVCEKLAGEDGYMFLEFAGEQGADAIQGIVYEDVYSWEELEDIVEDIVDNRTTDYADLKVLCFDTYDGIINLAEKEAIDLWNRKNPEKRTDTISAAWGGFQKGEKKAFELIFDIIVRLSRVGVRCIVLGHVKNKNETDVASGVTYKTLTSDVDNIYFNLLKKKMHFLGLAYYDRSIITEKTGKKNPVTKKDITVNKVADQRRKIKFRDDNVAIDSGSRFADITPEIDFDPDLFIEALTDAIKVEQSKSGKSFEEAEKEQEKQELEKIKMLAEEEKIAKKNKEIKEGVDKILEFVKANLSNKDIIKPIIEKSKELGYKNPSELNDLKDVKTVLALIK